MSETKTVLQIPAYYTPDGERTCRVAGSGTCRLLRSMFADTEHFCAWDDAEVVDPGGGFLKPVNGCPLCGSAEVIRLALDGLVYDGEHHKQWHLEQILLYLVGEEGYRNLAEQERWEMGIAP